MKKLLFLSISLVMTGQLIKAQVSETTRFMSQGEQNAFFTSIPDMTADLAASVWEKYAKRLKGKLRKDKKTGEYFVDNAVVEEMSSNTIDVYCRFGESSVDVTDAYFWFDLGGAYLSTADKPETSEKAIALVNEYVRLAQKTAAEQQLELQEEILRAFEKDLQKLDKEKMGFEKKIEEARALIAKMEMSIAENDRAQAAKKDEISVQLEQVKAAKARVQTFN